jgi:hypothetical protein
VAVGVATYTTCHPLIGVMRFGVHPLTATCNKRLFGQGPATGPTTSLTRLVTISESGDSDDIGVSEHSIGTCSSDGSDVI